MSVFAFETRAIHAQAQPSQGRRQSRAEEQLLLTEINGRAVLDHLDGPNSTVNLTTFGTVREACPKCLHPHLTLILRQRNVRAAHLFCVECKGCFDAHYTSGASALTV
ncbi:MAG: hypothetical protein H7335_01300 [Massilia sp.]|nr:hypothetical protein [Massilia sp.]